MNMQSKRCKRLLVMGETSNQQFLDLDNNQNSLGAIQLAGGQIVKNSNRIVENSHESADALNLHDISSSYPSCSSHIRHLD